MDGWDTKPPPSQNNTVFFVLTHEDPRNAGDGNPEGKHEEEDENDHRPRNQLIVHLQVHMPGERLYFLVFLKNEKFHLRVSRPPMRAIARVETAQAGI